MSPALTGPETEKLNLRYTCGYVQIVANFQIARPADRGQSIVPLEPDYAAGLGLPRLWAVSIWPNSHCADRGHSRSLASSHVRCNRRIILGRVHHCRIRSGRPDHPRPESTAPAQLDTELAEGTRRINLFSTPAGLASLLIRYNSFMHDAAQTVSNARAFRAAAVRAAAPAA